MDLVHVTNAAASKGDDSMSPLSGSEEKAERAAKMVLSTLHQEGIREFLNHKEVIKDPHRGWCFLQDRGKPS